ncbi:MAG: TMEM43 family protein [Lysobacter sp.]
MTWRLGLVVLLLASGAAFAQDKPATPTPEGVPQPGAELRDRDFGVGSDQFGLDRRVEMYQWRRVGEDRYERVWKAAWIDSSGFAEGYRNPPELPLDSRRWWSSSATLDGRPLDKIVLKSLGQWQDFRPGFSRLPGNLAATFQPEGDGLISSQNPLDPQVGDLRISWRELILPPLQGKVELRDGRWQLAPPARAVPDAGADPAMRAEEAMQAQSEDDSRWWPWLFGGLALVAVFVAVKRHRPRG